MAPKDMMKEALLREFNMENETVKEEKTIQKNIAIQEKVTKDTVKNMKTDITDTVNIMENTRICIVSVSRDSDSPINFANS